MVKYYSFGGKELRETDNPEKKCWIYMQSPTPEEIDDIACLTTVPDSFLKAALDEEEAAHIDIEDSSRLIVVDIPKMNESSEMFTIPLAMIQTDDYFITVCTDGTNVLNDFINGKIKCLDITSIPIFMYKIMYNCFARFLYYLRQIDKASDRIQKSLSKSMQNKELLQLLTLQKSLVFFSASLSANYSVVQKLVAGASKVARSEQRERELDILEDVKIESKQALEMCSVYREIIKSTMDAFAAVVNNNQNLVMKFLAAITIILSIPMVIAGFWGMNTGVPFGGKVWGFWVTIGISAVASIITCVVMIKKKML